MAGKKTAVFGIYANARQAEAAVDALVLDSFSNSDVSVLLPDDQTTKDFAHEKHTKAPEGASRKSDRKKPIRTRSSKEFCRKFFTAQITLTANRHRVLRNRSRAFRAKI